MFLDIDSLRMGLVWLCLLGIMISFLTSRIFSNKKLWGLLLVGLSLSFLSSNVLFFYLMFELSVVPIVLMILFYGSQPERLSARVYLLLYTMLFSIPFLVLILLFLKSFLIRKIIICNSIVVLIIVIPFLVKIPVFGLHFWLPKAHVEARTSGSIILAGVLLKLGSYGILRLINVLTIIFWGHTGVWIILAFLARIITLIQSDVKKIIAYSRVVHITFIVVAIAALNKSKMGIVLIISLTHALSSILLFFKGGLRRTINKSRLMVLLSREETFSWFSYFGGAALVINASMPPAASFIPEIVLLVTIVKTTSILIVFFLMLRLMVCYYNVLLMKRLFTQTKTLQLNKRVTTTANFSNIAIISFILILYLYFWALFLFKQRTDCCSVI